MPWELHIDKPVAQTEAYFNAYRDGIEQGLRGLKTAGWK